jgi:tRNA A37 threonylcarbamoyladenosine biosynthesis protein TsaE
MKKSVTRYAELQQWAHAFAEGKFDLLILVGTSGIGKSRIVRDRVQEIAHIIEGRTTAFQLYRELFEHRGDVLVIDDVDQLYSDRDAVGLLKCLCQSEEVKTVAWHSASSKLAKAGIPLEFDTRSKVAIIGNTWKQANVNT